MWLNKHANTERRLILMRGLPGSGKSTLAKELAGAEGQIHSTDDLFMVEGKYQFDPALLSLNHAKNIENVSHAMQRGITPIVVDNTNTRAYEMKQYVLLAQKYDYAVEIHTPATDWAWDASQLASKNTHGVPLDAIQKMHDRFEHDLSVDDIMNSKAPWEA